MSNHTDPNQLPVYDITQHNILYTDTFKEWADKCNAVIDVLNRTDFLVAEELTNELTNVVFKNGDFVNGELVPGAVQIISAPKTFDAVTNFEDDVIFGNLADVTFKDSVTFEDNNLIKDTGSLTVEGPSIFWNEIAIKQDTEHGISEQTIGYRANDEKYTRLISSAPFEVPKLIVTGNFVELNSIHYELPDDSYGNDNETKYGNNETDGRVYYLKNIGTKLAGDIFEEDGEINGGPTTSNNLIWQKDLSSMSFSPEHNIEYYGPDGELKDSFFVPDRNATSLDCTNIEIPAPAITENLQPEGLSEDFIPKDGHIHIEIWAAPIPLGKCVTSNSCIDNVSEDECLLIGGIWSLEQSCIAGSFDITKDYNQRPANLSPLRLIGEAIRFTIVVTNPGDLPLTNVIVSDSILPEYRENISGNTGLFTGTTLSPRQTKTISYDYIVTYDDAVLGLPIINNAYVTGSPNQETPIYINTPIFVNDIGGLPDLTINKTYDPPNNGSFFIVGEAITYHISVTNDGDNIARDVIITDAMTRDIDSTTGDIELFVGGSDIAGGETKTVSYEHTILESEYNNLPLSNGACVDSYSVDGQPVEISYPTSTLCTPDVEINNILNIGTFDVGLEILGQLTIDNELALDNSPPYIVGEDAIFEVEIINTGSNNLSNVTLSIFEDTAGEWIAGNHITVLEDNDDLFTDGISTFEPGRIATVRYSYQITQADAGNGITNRAKVQTDQGEIDSNPVVIADGDITISLNSAQVIVETTLENELVYLPVIPTPGTLTVDWNDGNIEEFSIANFPSHTYQNAGTYYVSITGTATQWTGASTVENGQGTENSSPEIGFEKGYWPWIKAIVSWGDLGPGLTHIDLRGVYGLSGGTIDPALPTSVTSLKSMFRYWGSVSSVAYGEYSDVIIPDIIGLQTGAVTDMSQMFYNAPAFNQPIGSWDTSAVTEMEYMFRGATVFNQDISSWDTGAVTNMRNMFFSAYAFNQPIGTKYRKVDGTLTDDQTAGRNGEDYAYTSWKTRAVTNMGLMFYSARDFNQPIDSWDTSAVNRMGSMFGSTRDFNQPIGSWDTGAVTVMTSMFSGAAAFNQDISSWNTSDVEDMFLMFANTTAFNQPLNTQFRNAAGEIVASDDPTYRYTSWDTGAVTRMSRMFQNATAFNQPIGSWDTSIVTNMTELFQNATAFNQDISSWDVSAVHSLATDWGMVNMFQGATSWSTENYDLALNAFAAQTVQSGVEWTNTPACRTVDPIPAGLSTWTITDGGVC